MDVMPLLLALLVGVLLGVLVGVLLAGALAARRAARVPAAQNPALAAARHATEVLQVRHEEAALRSELREQLAGLQAGVRSLTGELEAADRRYDELVDRHARQQAEQQARQQTESRVLQALAPVASTLESMQGTVTRLESQRAEQHGQLASQLRHALESEERLRSTAETLASALNSNSTRGVWGETQLRRVVEAAGLLQYVDFDMQQSIVSDAGIGRPDMVVRLPGGKCMAVDAKVPFNSYLEAVAVPASGSADDQARRATLMKSHVKALRDHITALGSKAYWNGLDVSPEMVIAFVPSESLLSSALETDPGIIEYAFSRRVALASPVTLWSVLKTVAFSWQQDVVTEEAKALFDVSRELHGRLATMAAHVEKLGRAIEGSVKSYNGFVGSLERQVLPSARKLAGLDPAKQIGAPPPIEEPRRELAAYELVAELERVGESQRVVEVA
ncbi:DNA recombination protein RmuC [uncultured Amnibacterium sp.]|uniref:DNA recombination protein RmuC n=1 Tax=uncultured Amnibacterium sp. TaxID=1631851 RepID=UPI0035CBEAC1